jgi:hypothetical protein
VDAGVREGEQVAHCAGAGVIAFTWSALNLNSTESLPCSTVKGLVTSMCFASCSKPSIRSPLLTLPFSKWLMLSGVDGNDSPPC